jgi:hypothetical protein
MKTVAAAMMLAASPAVVTPAVAHADPVPTTDEVVAILAKLADPGIPAANKTDIVSPGFSPDDAGTIDNHLGRMDAVGGLLPPNFVVTDIEPAPANFAGATEATTGGYKHVTHPRPIVLVNQGGHWLITNDTAMTVLDALWTTSQREPPENHWAK